MKKIEPNTIAVNLTLNSIRPKVSIIHNADGSQKLILEYDVPPTLIKEFNDWVIDMKHLSSRENKQEKGIDY